MPSIQTQVLYLHRKLDPLPDKQYLRALWKSSLMKNLITKKTREKVKEKQTRGKKNWWNLIYSCVSEGDKIHTIEVIMRKEEVKGQNKVLQTFQSKSCCQSF